MSSTLGYDVSFNSEPKTVVITGGVGSFGQAFTKFLIGRPEIGTIRIFSRDEFKQSEMQKKFTSSKLRFFIGDVRDENRVQSALSGADIVIHAAAMKQVPACEYNPQEAIKTNITGTENVINACIEQGVGRAVFISTDKAVDPVNLYGATKKVAEKVWINANNLHKTKFSLTRWGNVVGSRGSVIPLFKEQAKTGTVTVTHKDMTRFLITLDEAVEYVWWVLGHMEGGEAFVPDIKSAKVVDIAKFVAPKAKIKFIGIREGEKLHETLGAKYFSNDKHRLMDIKELKDFLCQL
jgi:UDP-N-acetylglucosamine 4,6-dehydratase